MHKMDRSEENADSAAKQKIEKKQCAKLAARQEHSTEVDGTSTDGTADLEPSSDPRESTSANSNCNE